MGRRKHKPQNKAICIYKNGYGGKNERKIYKVFQNTIPNFERPKYFLSEFYFDEDGRPTYQKLIAKANQITDINQKLSDLLGYKVTLL